MYINALRSLLSLKQRDNYPMYTMTYYGDYGFDDFLTKGVTNDADLINYVSSRLLKGKKINAGMPEIGCTSFITRNKKGDVLYARNYDYPYCPFVLVKTKPDNGHASVSVVDLTALGYRKDFLPKKIKDRLALLGAPYLPFDGMNEKGLAISILVVPKTDLPNDPDKITLNTLTANRLILDKAATVDEALELFKKYNIYFSQDIFVHFLVADSSGKSALVEYWDGAMHIKEEHVASNFLAHNQLSITENQEWCEFERYHKVNAALDAGGGIMEEMEAAQLLCDVGIYDKEIDILQWSAVYNLTQRSGLVFPNRRLQSAHRFTVNRV